MRNLYELTNQERRILQWVIKGQRNAKIADEMCLSVRTVENHIYHIFDKLGVSSRTEAAMYGLSMGLLTQAELGATLDEPQG
jgi:DNA-binding NarL/FixJ family response regulator